MYKSNHALARSDPTSAPPFYPDSYLRVIPSPSLSSPGPSVRYVRNLTKSPSTNTLPSSSLPIRSPSNLRVPAYSIIHPISSTLQRQKHVSRVPSRATHLQHIRDTLPAVMHGQTNRVTEPLPWTVDLGDDSEFSHSVETKQRTVRQASDPMPLTSTGSLVPPRPSRNVDMVFGSRAGRPVRRVSSVPVTLDDRYIFSVNPNAVPPCSPPPKYSIVPAPSVNGSSTSYLLSPRSRTLPYMPMERSDSSCSEDGSYSSVSPLPITPLYSVEDNSPRLRLSSSTTSISSTSICSFSPRDEDDKDLFDLLPAEQDDGLNRPIETFLHDIDELSMSVWPDEAGHIILLPPVPLKSHKRAHQHTSDVLS
ncbi:hypothetical protein [Phaffia rhodozyma]|uniref:Uncharacterized protein n=1 Tax=Phaffia rhodozyma TaxID=264483 RepID=A0A0F7SPB6_PHARH|nr:hypothetical protein [Phaffia rhodozyma]